VLSVAREKPIGASVGNVAIFAGGEEQKGQDSGELIAQIRH
jgi:hypothetical protein